MLKGLQQIFLVRLVVTFSPQFSSHPSEGHLKNGTDCLQTECCVLVSGRTVGLNCFMEWQFSLTQ